MTDHRWIYVLCAVLCLVAQSYLTLFDTMEYNPQGSSVYGDSPGNPHALLQGIFPPQGSNPLWDKLLWIRIDPGIESCNDSWVEKIRWRRDKLPTPIFLGFPCGSAGKASACNVGDLGSIPGLERSPGEGKGYPLQSSGLENSMVCIAHGSKRVGCDFHFTTSYLQLFT